MWKKALGIDVDCRKGVALVWEPEVEEPIELKGVRFVYIYKNDELIGKACDLSLDITEYRVKPKNRFLDIDVKLD